MALGSSADAGNQENECKKKYGIFLVHCFFVVSLTAKLTKFSMKHSGKAKNILRLLLVKIPLAFVAITFLWVLLLKWVPVHYTPLMAIRSIEYRSDDKFHTYKSWQPLENISPSLAMAVMAGEDNRFLEHHGFDFVELKKALKEKKSGKRVRGASTISQQTAKNVFLWPGKSLFRKGLEAYFTLLIELVWGKERIMEVYLNVAEMGKGIYGAEAAAERLFQTRASKLGKYQSSLIAASLPNPIKRRADLPTSYHKKRASDIRRLMNNLQTPEWLKR